MKPYFSIVIPTLNEEKCLPNLLADLEAQTFSSFEVVHVDGNSDDATVTEAEKSRSKLQLSTHIIKKRNVSAQRNLGAQKAVGEWVIFIDADSRIPHYFLQGIKYQLEKYDKVDIFSCLIDTKRYPLKQRPFVEVMNLSFEIHARFSPLAIGALVGMRRIVCSEFTFNETIPLGEDQDLVQKIIKGGFTFKLFKEPGYEFCLRRIEKDGTLNLAKIYMQSNLYFLSNKQLFKSLPEYPMMGGTYYEEDSSDFHDDSGSSEHR